MDIGERQRLIEQTQKELLDKLRKYEDGIKVNENEDLIGYVFTIPRDVYKELFGGL